MKTSEYTRVTPEKTTPLPPVVTAEFKYLDYAVGRTTDAAILRHSVNWKDDEALTKIRGSRAVDLGEFIASVTNACIAIAPGKELELAEALGEIMDEMKSLAKEKCATTELDDMEVGCCGPCRARTVLTRLGIEI